MGKLNALPKAAPAVPQATLGSTDRRPDRAAPNRTPDDFPRLTGGERLLIDTLRRRQLRTRGDLLAAEQLAARSNLRELSRRALAARDKLPPA